jgi:hypothetical protein
MSSTVDAATVPSVWKVFAQIICQQTMNSRALTGKAASWIINRAA